METPASTKTTPMGIQATPGTIGDAIGKLYSDLRNTEVEFSTVSNSNVIILTSSDTPRTRLDSIVSTFAEVHPSRFFVVVLDDTAPDLSATVSAVCHSLGGDQKVCSEIIRATLPAKSLARLPSILRAHLVSGRVTEVFITDDAAANRLFPTISPAADRVFFDSHFFRRGLETVHTVIEQFPKVTDFEWLRLSPWREALSQAFERGLVLSALEALCEVRIKFQCQSQSEPIPVPVMLLASWIISRMKLEIMGFSEEVLHTRAKSGRLIPFVFLRSALLAGSTAGSVETTRDAKSLIDELTLEFDEKAPFSKLHLASSEGIVTEIDFKPPLRLTRPVEDDGEDALLKKFYLIGESVANFGTSLEVALHIKDTFIDR